MPNLRTFNAGEMSRITPLVGSIDVDADMEGRTLEIELEKALEKFVRAQELRGYTLIAMPGGIKNPQWATHPDGTPKAWYARRGIDKQNAEGQLEYSKREESLEESEGIVEYRCFGFFIAPMTLMQIKKHEDEIYAEERAARNPVVFGPGGV